MSNWTNGGQNCFPDINTSCIYYGAYCTDTIDYVPNNVVELFLPVISFTIRLKSKL